VNKFLLPLLLVLTGCGTPFNFNAFDQVKPGMTYSEVEAIVGKPLTVTLRKDGKTLWYWHHDNGLKSYQASALFKDGKVCTDLEVLNPRLAAELEAAEEKARINKEKARIDKENARKEYVFTHPQLSDRILEAILNAKVLIGMPEEAVFASWGKPERKNVSVGSYGRHETWVYGSTYLFFENGVMTSWHSSE